ncbi:uncharacterized protein NEMAJ01_0879 [Nematocida major]|uniref:uncharacterized protein n=1 Tax=Nematocida major TaxID=1912982 RepID=UPI0020078C84|nr:uncharacterized protein NEMAJ01_0879 [Nematocida major]KAH9385983.1 hypothetical protein NEMAJ01_0879 [Nematocida major]
MKRELSKIACACALIYYCACAMMHERAEHGSMQRSQDAAYSDFIEMKDPGNFYTVTPMRDSPKPCCFRRLFRNKKRVCGLIVVVCIALASLLALTCLNIKNTQRELALNKCNEILISNAKTCYSMSKDGSILERLQLVRSDKIFSGSLHASSMKNKPICTTTVSGFNETLSNTEKHLSVLHSLCQLAVEKSMAPITRFVENGYALSGKAMPSEEELKYFTKLFARSIRTQKPHIIYTLVNLYSPDAIAPSMLKSLKNAGGYCKPPK